MSTRVRRTELQSAIRTFLGYLEDLEQSTLDQSRTKLRLVMNYSQKDFVTHALAEHLLLRMPAETLVRRVGEEFVLPAAPLDLMAFSYSLLYQLKLSWKLELREILSRSAFQGTGLEGRWADFKVKVIKPLMQGVQYVQEWIESGEEAEGALDPGEVFRYALMAYEGSEAPAASSPQAPPPPPRREELSEDLIATQPTASYVRPASAPPDGDALEALEAALDEGGHSPDLSVDAQILAVELQKGEPDPQRLGELLAGFARADEQLLGHCMALLLEVCPPLRSRRRKAEAETQLSLPPRKKKKTAKKKAAKKKAAKKKAAKKKKAATKKAATKKKKTAKKKKATKKTKR